MRPAPWRVQIRGPQAMRTLPRGPGHLTPCGGVCRGCLSHADTPHTSSPRPSHLEQAYPAGPRRASLQVQVKKKKRTRENHTCWGPPRGCEAPSPTPTPQPHPSPHTASHPEVPASPTPPSLSYPVSWPALLSLTGPPFTPSTPLPKLPWEEALGKGWSRAPGLAAKRTNFACSKWILETRLWAWCDRSQAPHAGVRPPGAGLAGCPPHWPQLLL